MNWYKQEQLKRFEKIAIGLGGIEPGRGFGRRFKDIGKGIKEVGRGFRELIKNLIDSGVAIKDIIKGLEETFGGIANIPREIWWIVRKYFPPNAQGYDWKNKQYKKIYDLLP